MAAENARLVQAAVHDSAAAEEGLRAAKAEWFPALSVTGNAFGFNPDDPIGLGMIQIPDDWHSLYATNLSLRYPLFTGGRRANTVRQVRESVGAASARLEAERLRNAYECRSAFLNLLVADRMVAAAEASLHRVEVIGRDTGNLFAEGLADSIDLLETKMSLRKASRSLETARNTRRNASAVLAKIIGAPEGTTIVPAGKMPEPVGLPEADLPPADIEARPELRMIDRELAALRYQRSSIRGSYWPTVSTQGGCAFVRPDIGQPDVSWNSLWFVGLSFSWELNLGMKDSALSGQALERIRSMELTRGDTEQAFLLKARTARNDIDEAFSLYRLSREEYVIASDRYRLASGKAKAGAMSVNRLFELEAELAATEQEMEAARLRYFLAVTDYLYAVGSESLLEEI
jgi:outer membrane protein TolC